MKTLKFKKVYANLPGLLTGFAFLREMEGENRGKILLTPAKESESRPSVNVTSFAILKPDLYQWVKEGKLIDAEI